MPDKSFVQPLSGDEIRKDLLAQISKKLEGSCDLRATDAYPRGYSAKFSYSIECYGLDVVTIEGEVKAGSQNTDLDTTVTAIHGSSEIGQEQELNAVRERSNQDQPVLAKTAEGGEEVRQRRYARRVIAPHGPVELPPDTAGGTEEFVE